MYMAVCCNDMEPQQNTHACRCNTRQRVQREVEGFYNNEEPTPEERLTNIMAAAKEKPQSFLKGLRVLRNTAGDSVHTKIFGRKAQVPTPHHVIYDFVIALMHTHSTSDLYSEWSERIEAPTRSNTHAVGWQL